MGTADAPPIDRIWIHGSRVGQAQSGAGGIRQAAGTDPCTTHVEAAEVLGVCIKTVQRRLNGALVLLATELKDLYPKLDEA
jgi:hypothetical protein